MRSAGQPRCAASLRRSKSDQFFDLMCVSDRNLPPADQDRGGVHQSDDGGAHSGYNCAAGGRGVRDLASGGSRAVAAAQYALRGALQPGLQLLGFQWLRLKP